MTENPLRRDYWLGTTDPRPLAIFRILFGSVVLADLLHQLGNVRAFLSDEGFAPRSGVPGPAMSWSLFRWVGNPTAVTILYLAGCVAVTAFLVGYRTRLAQAATYVFLASLYLRGSNFVALGEDRVVGAMSFWLLFADSGAVWSLDWISRRRTGGPVPAIGLRLLQWQFALILLFAGLHKLGTWSDGHALYRFLQIPAFATPFGMAFLAWPGLCSTLTLSIPAIELAAPVLLIPLAPLAPRSMRAAGMLAVGALFVGILACLYVGAFPWAMLAGLALFVLPEWLDRLGWVVPAVRAAGAPPSSAYRAVLPVAGMVQLGLVIWFLFAVWLRLAVGQPLITELRVTGLWQNWMLFVQVKGLSSDSWTDVGTLADGSRQEVLERTAPAIVTSAAPERHWEQIRFLLSRSGRLRGAIADYACREFDRNSPIPLARIEFDLHERRVVDPGEPAATETVRTFDEPCP